MKQPQAHRSGFYNSSLYSVGVRAGSRVFSWRVYSCVCYVLFSMCACVAVSNVCTRAEGDGVGCRAWIGNAYTANLANRLPVVRVTTVARCRCPRTRNCGSCTSLLMPTLISPSFQWYRMSLMVYPTPETCQTHRTLSLTLRSIMFSSRWWRWNTRVLTARLSWAESSDSVNLVVAQYGW